MQQVRNPILPGFNPDPSIVRVGFDYYIATSTFKWYPGVQIHHSKDLANWRLAIRPLSRKKQLDMRGNQDGGGVWGPCLSHDGEQSWLVYTDVKRCDGAFTDTRNYIVHSPTIEGPWSDPEFIDSSGFDPSLFHDNGRKWFLNVLVDHRQRPNLFAGIALQEFDATIGKLVGPRKNIYVGTELKWTEAPHLYKHNGWYYLLTAEGGGVYNHACTLARARNIWGPYDTHPQKYILTSKDAPTAALQKAGHGDLVQTPDGEVYIVHLAGRPVDERRRCILGRETAIQQAYWGDDDWLYVKNGPVPSLFVEVPGTYDDAAYWAETRYDFNKELHKDFQWLRTPETDRIFYVRGGKLILIGRESIGSWFEQALVARRQTHFSYDAETVMDFSPSDERQFPGLTAYYNRHDYFYLAVTSNQNGERELQIMHTKLSWPVSQLDASETNCIRVPNTGKIRLALSIRGGQTLQFFYSFSNGDLQEIGPVFDATVLSDDTYADMDYVRFTGAFVGMACSDLNGTGLEAVFDHFIYRPVHHPSDRY